MHASVGEIESAIAEEEADELTCRVRFSASQRLPPWLYASSLAALWSLLEFGPVKPTALLEAG